MVQLKCWARQDIEHFTVKKTCAFINEKLLSDWTALQLATFKISFPNWVFREGYSGALLDSNACMETKLGPYGGNTSVHIPEGRKPVITFGQDEVIFRSSQLNEWRYYFTYESTRCGADGFYMVAVQKRHYLSLYSLDT